MFLKMLRFRGVNFLVGSVFLLHGMGFVLVGLIVVRFFVMFRGAGQGFTGKKFDRGTVRGRQRRHGGLRLFMRMSGIVVFQVFENVADVQESITIEADVHESRLHAGEDAGDFSLVDAANEREFFFPLDVNFD